MNNTSLNLIKAKPGNRFLAFLADCLIAFLFAVPGILISIYGNYKEGYSELLDIGGCLIAFFSGSIYILISDGLNDGRSYGKRWLGIKVVNTENGTDCSLGKSIFRNFILLLTMIPFLGILLFLAEGILTLANPQGKRIGDMLATTMVIEN